MTSETRTVHDVLARIGLHVPANEVVSGHFGPGTIAALRWFQRQARLPVTGRVNAQTSAALEREAGAIEGNIASIAGMLLLPNGQPAKGVAIRLYERSFGGQSRLLSEAKADELGSYSLEYDSSEAVRGLELRAVAGNGEVVPLAAPMYGVLRAENRNLIVPASFSESKSEYVRLSRDVASQIGEAKIGESKENREQQDLTFLSRTTRWDARRIALLAISEKLGEKAGIGEVAAYGLLRAGMPSDEDLLSLVQADTVKAALIRARDAGIVDLSNRKIGTAVKAFERFAATKFTETTLPGTASTLGEMLEVSGLSNPKRKKVIEILAATVGDSKAFWSAIDSTNLSSREVETLRVQGKLGALTGNSAAIVKSLGAGMRSVDELASVVAMDLYRPESWKTMVRGLATRGVEVDNLIPSAYSGTDTEDRLENYAKDAARKVRLAFPTLVTGRRLEDGDLEVPAVGRAGNKRAARLVSNADALGFKIGATPLSAFVKKADPRQLFKGVPESKRAEALESLRTLQRVYQITPNDDAMRATLQAGITSAHDIARFTQSEFLERFGGNYASPIEAERVYARADQTTTVIYSFFAASQQLPSETPLDRVGAGQGELSRAVENLTDQIPTLENLFGTFDYCECEHCRSVLSPVAYLVDLLRFLDPEDAKWEVWQSKHTGAEFADQQKKPYEVLDERRPDLSCIALTCDNTNVAMPYIDLVCEILEYQVAHGGLAEETVRDNEGYVQEDLIAEPVNLIPEAYEELAQAHFPRSLPFDLPLASVRRFLANFDTSLADLLDMFCSTESLFEVPAEGYPRSAVFFEQLGIGPVLAKVLADPSVHANWHLLYGKDSGSEEVRRELANVKQLSRHLDVSYKELVALIQTRFVNPKLANLVTLDKLGLEPEEVLRLKGVVGFDPLTDADKADLEARLVGLSEEHGTTGFDAVAWLDTTFAAGGFDGVVVIADLGSDGSFDEARLRYSDDTSSSPESDRLIDQELFLRLNLLVRLWKHLGWSLPDADTALTTLAPMANQASLADFGIQLQTGLVYLAHLDKIAARFNVGTKARAEWLTLWGDIPSFGQDSVYVSTFLSPSTVGDLSGEDNPFEHPTGDYLAAAPQLSDHRLLVQGTLGLTADEVDAVLASRSVDPSSASLSLELVSSLYRHRLLAESLKLSVGELVKLIRITGIDPFPQLPTTAPTDLNGDTPYGQTLEFIDVVDQLAARDLDPELLVYLLEHGVDPVGRFRDQAHPPFATIRLLRDTIRTAEETSRLSTEDVSHTELMSALLNLFEEAVADRALAMIDGTGVIGVSESGVEPADALDDAVVASEPMLALSYDPVSQTQRLSVAGVLRADDMTRIADGSPPDLLLRLVNVAAADQRSYFADYFATDAPDAPAIFAAADFDTVFEPAPSGASDSEIEAHSSAQRLRIADAIRDRVVEAATHRAALDVLISEDPEAEDLIRVLSSNEGLLSDPSTPALSLLESLRACASEGCTVTSFDSAGGELSVRTSPDVTTVGGPVGAERVVFEGGLEVPDSGAFRFMVRLEKSGASTTFTLGSEDVVVLSGEAAADDVSVEAAVELPAGIVHPYRLVVDGLQGGEARLELVGASTPSGPASQLGLIPRVDVEIATRALRLLGKSVLLANALPLSASELSHALSNPDDFAGIDLRDLPAWEDDALAAYAPTLFERMRSLMSWARLKSALHDDSEEILGLMSAARSLRTIGLSDDDAKKELRNALVRRLASLSRRQEEVVGEAVSTLGFEAVASSSSDMVEMPDFARPEGLLKIWKLLEMAAAIGVTPSVLSGWARPDPDSHAAKGVRDTLRAQFDTITWRRLVKPIADGLRQAKRDSLVAYLLHRHPVGFDIPEQLFEHFLIDPGMEPVVLTSRVRLALSSIQTFVQRALLNLESQVSPSAIDADQWGWMKRYRVWEANRKIFLFPENFLEPEFRDDRSHLYEALESELLQGDITDELAERAFLTYVKGLEAVARLETVAVYAEEDSLDPTQNILHVFGRTFNKPHSYYYRRYAARFWTPWEAMDVEVEGDHLAPVMWRERLYLFWFTFLERSETKEQSGTIEDQAKSEPAGVKTSVEAILHWTSLADGEWAPPRAAGLDEPLVFRLYDYSNSYESESESESVERSEAGLRGAVLGRTRLIIGTFRDLDPRQMYVHVAKEMDGDQDGALYVQLGLQHYAPGLGEIPHVTIQGGKSYRLESPYSVPEPFNGHLTSAQSVPFSSMDPLASRFLGSDKLTEAYTGKVVTTDIGGKASTANTPAARHVLGDVGDYSLIYPANRYSLTNSELDNLLRPFFFQDRRHSFYVEPTVTESTFVESEPYLALVEYNPDLRVRIEDLVMVESFPGDQHPIDLTDIDPGYIDPAPEQDWLTNPAVAIDYQGTPVVNVGGLDFEKGGLLARDLSPTLEAGKAGLDTSRGPLMGTRMQTYASKVEMDGTIEIIGGAGIGAASIRKIARNKRRG